MNEFEEVLKEMPRLSQRQDSVSAQIRDLILVANKLGMYDVADLLVRISERK
jgi:hypothetical protein